MRRRDPIPRVAQGQPGLAAHLLRVALSQVYSFYQHPRTNNVLFIWTRHGGHNATKRLAAQDGVRLDLLRIAKEQGIIIKKEITQKEGEVSGDQLKTDVASSGRQ
ncbi:twinfilin-1 [Penicillium chermesinum]|nr:twinfilin-1 [Penicillium chermesinum]